MYCDKCGGPVANAEAKRGHERVCSGSSARSRTKSLLDDADLDNPGAPGAYSIVLSHEGKQFYYIGESVSFRQRLKEHTTDQPSIAIPKDGKLYEYSSYQVVDIHRFEPVEGDEYTRKKRERELLCEVAIETGRTDILGGR